MSHQNQTNTESGNVAIYIAVVMAAIMISSTAVFAILLARQVSLTRDVVASERALQASNAGAEHILWEIAQGTLSNPSEEIRIQGFVSYPDPEGRAEYRACGRIGPLFRVAALYQGKVRRLAGGDSDCLPWED